MRFFRRSHLLGTGVLRWPPDEDPDDLEKVGPDLAQTVGLLDVGNQWVRFDTRLEGTQVVLFAIVTALRGPALRRDPQRGIAPQLPYVGEAVHLGAGQLFCLNSFGAAMTGIGTMPDDPASDSGDWLRRAGLYRAHNHLVELRALKRRKPPIADA